MTSARLRDKTGLLCFVVSSLVMSSWSATAATLPEGTCYGLPSKVVTPGFSYDVVTTSPEEVKSDLFRLWDENLQLPVKPEERFNWLYRDAPEPAQIVFVLRARNGDGATRAVGTNGITVRRFQLGAGVEGRAAVSGDLAVELAHRGLLPALRLVRAVRELAEKDFDLTYGFPNKKAEGVMARAGFHVLGKTTRYARVLRHAPYIEKVVERLALPPNVARVVSDDRVVRALGPVADVGRLVRGAPSFARARARYTLEWPRTFDDRFDALWRAARRDYDVVGCRTSTFLRWRYPECRFATLVRKDDRSLAAYAIIEQDAETGAAHLRDVFGHKEALGPLVDLLLPALWRRGAASVSVRFLGAPYFAEVLQAREFEPRGEHRTVVVQTGGSMEVERARDAKDAQRWHLFDIDEDA